LKAPGEHEPVIPESSSRVVAVVGLDAIGRPLDEENVFRSSVYSQLTGIPTGSPVTSASVACALLAPKGIFKGSPPHAQKIVFLNKADDPDRLAAGEAIAAAVRERGNEKVRQVLIGSLWPAPRIRKRYVSCAD
jgi:probable selenium-dependent hydroxylase accessory protein YqeC